MGLLFSTPTNHILIGFLSAVAIAAAWRGTHLFRLVLRGKSRSERPLWLTRGIRAEIVSTAAIILALGIWFELRWLVIFGVIFLLEELYETGFVILAIRYAKSS